jgi:hypothetical protein|tara:strand:+ start:737 stop:1366 length:630 start_codon:yes stop_codon:yes gene_type:complete
MQNKINSGSLDTLKPGQCLLVNCRPTTSGDKMYLEFAEAMETSPSRLSTSALSTLNSDDPRFQQKARRAWTTATPKRMMELFGIDVSEENTNWTEGMVGNREVQMLPLNIVNPYHPELDKFFKIQIRETVDPSEWQAENVERSAKRKGTEGAFITHKSFYIFSNPTVVLADEDEVIEHQMLDADAVEPGKEATKVNVDTGEITESTMGI